MLLDFEHLRDPLACDKGEGELLYGLVRALRPEVCVETGSHKLQSSLYIANALEDNNKGHLWTVDPYDHGQDETLGNISKGLSERVTYQRIRGDELKLKDKINFAFIDGFHTKQDVLEEIDNLWPQLAPEAVVVFHDAQNEPTNLKDGVTAALVARKLKTVRLPTKYSLRVYTHEA
jgi:predicted O-methyltransferase YrrM